MDNQETNQAELIFQVKNMLGLISILMDYLPKHAQFHFSRVGVKLYKALCEVLGTDDIGDAPMLATRDTLTDWLKDEDIPDGLRDIVENLLGHLDGMEAGLDEVCDHLLSPEETDVEEKLDTDLWNIWGDENPLN